MTMLVYGLITGVLFGFLLQKGRVLRYDRQLGALRLLDMTIVKFMFSTVVVGMVGVYLLKDFGLAKLSVKPTSSARTSSAASSSGSAGVSSAIVPGPRRVPSGREGGTPSGASWGCSSARPCMPRPFPS